VLYPAELRGRCLVHQMISAFQSPPWGITRASFAPRQTEPTPDSCELYQLPRPGEKAHWRSTGSREAGRFAVRHACAVRDDIEPPASERRSRLALLWQNWSQCYPELNHL
jgi:hypothetical protein